MARSIPFGRMAQPEEIARAAVFLASENAGFVTGQTLHVNGDSYLALRCAGRPRRAQTTKDQGGVYGSSPDQPAL